MTDLAGPWHLKSADGRYECDYAIPGDVHSALIKANIIPDPYAAQNCPIPDTNFLRKPSCHAGWDWNLAIMPFGAYGRMGLIEDGSSIRCSSIDFKQSLLATGAVKLNLSIHVDKCLENKPDDLVVELGDVTKIVKYKPYSGWDHVELNIEIEKPKLWWPAGSGEQNHFAPKPYKTYDFEDSKITLKQNGSQLTLSAIKPAYYVSLEADVAGHFGDNAFDLLPGETKSLSFIADDPTAKPNFTIRDLYSATCK